MFHSRGTIQSRAGVPDGTSWTTRGTWRRRMSSVARTPSPVMLRQIGNSSAQSAELGRRPARRVGLRYLIDHRCSMACAAGSLARRCRPAPSVACGCCTSGTSTPSTPKPHHAQGARACRGDGGHRHGPAVPAPRTGPRPRRARHTGRRRARGVPRPRRRPRGPSRQCRPADAGDPRRFVSLTESAEDRRGPALPTTVRARTTLEDRMACRLAHTVVLDTAAHCAYFTEQLGVPAAKLRRVWVGADDDMVRPSPLLTAGFRVFLYASFIPLHGLEHVVRAAHRLERAATPWPSRSSATARPPRRACPRRPARRHQRHVPGACRSRPSSTRWRAATCASGSSAPGPRRAGSCPTRSSTRLPPRVRWSRPTHRRRARCSSTASTLLCRAATHAPAALRELRDDGALRAASPNGATSCSGSGSRSTPYRRSSPPSCSSTSTPPRGHTR